MPVQVSQLERNTCGKSPDLQVMWSQETPAKDIVQVSTLEQAKSYIGKITPPKAQTQPKT